VVHCGIAFHGGNRLLHPSRQIETVFDALNQISRRADCQGEFQLLFFVQKMLFVMGDKPIGFGEKNGAANRGEFERLIRNYRGKDEADPEIGCIILNQPFFIPREHWIPAPDNWKPNIVSGKAYDDEQEWGKRIWTLVRPWMPSLVPAEASDEMIAAVSEPGRLYGQEYLHRSRLGQGAFRILVTDAYQKRCAISGERTLPVLQASHIKPYGDGPNRVDNGFLLRSDLHILFDRGYVTVTPDLRVEISRRIKEEYENGRDYYRFHGSSLAVLPTSQIDRPNHGFLRWHNERIFRSG
jgi:putative restriction endonuclease